MKKAMVSLKGIRARQILSAASIFLMGGIARQVVANGIERNGVSAESMSMGGTETGWAASPLGAMAANPAGLGFLQAPEIDISVVGATPQGRFTKFPSAAGNLDQSLRAFPEGAFAYPLKQVPLTFAGSFVADSAMVADWNYFDSPGGLGGHVSYGQQAHRSEIQVLRPALGVGVRINPRG